MACLYSMICADAGTMVDVHTVSRSASLLSSHGAGRQHTS